MTHLPRILATFVLGTVLAPVQRPEPPQRERIEHPRPSPGFPPPAPRPLLDALDRLDLAPAQRAAVDAIRADHERKMRDAHRRIVEDTLRELRGVLTPEQYSSVEALALREPPPPPKRPGIQR
jgi:hypothetical protein